MEEPEASLWTTTARPTLVSDPQSFSAKPPAMPAEALRGDTSNQSSTPFATLANSTPLNNELIAASKSNVVHLRVVDTADSTRQASDESRDPMDAELVLDGSEFDELLVSVERIDPLLSGRLLPAAEGTTEQGRGQQTESALEAIAKLDQQRTASRSAASAPGLDNLVPQPRQSSEAKKTTGPIVDLPRGTAPATRPRPGKKVRRFVTNPGGLPLEVMPRRRKLSETMWFVMGDQPRMLARHEAEELELDALDRLNNDYLERRIPESLRSMYSLEQ